MGLPGGVNDPVVRGTERRGCLAGLMLSQGTGSLAILVGMFLPGGLGTFEVAVIGSMVGAGGVSVVDAGIVVSFALFICSRWASRA